MAGGFDFDQLSRKLAGPMSRRGVFKAFGIAAGGAVVATLLKPLRAGALTTAECEQWVGPGATPCGQVCCARGQTCDGATGRCTCPAGTQGCGSSCCRGTCSNAGASCCCPAGSAPCGYSCCSKGVACVDPSTGTCGCPPGTTPCGTKAALTCCSAGQACGTGCPTALSLATGTPCCRTYQATCSTNGECCSGFCNQSKGGRCGCGTNAECPKATPICSSRHCAQT